MNMEKKVSTEYWVLGFHFFIELNVLPWIFKEHEILYLSYVLHQGHLSNQY